jgi:hypothetical protein
VCHRAVTMQLRERIRQARRASPSS